MPSLGSTLRRPAQRPFGGYVNHIWTALDPMALQLAARGQAQAQSFVSRQWHARNQAQPRVIAYLEAIKAMLAGAHHRHRMALEAQSVYQVRESRSDAVDFGRIGLGHNTNMSLMDSFVFGPGLMDRLHHSVVAMVECVVDLREAVRTYVA